MFPSLFTRREPQTRPLFAIGTLKVSKKVHWLASKGLVDPLLYVQRHIRGDWGDIDKDWRQANDVALEQGAPVTSRYRITPRLFLSVSTDDEQGTTIVKLPEEEDLN